MDPKVTPQPQAPAPPAAEQVPKPVNNDDALKYIVPINRTGLSMAAGYVALFSILIFPAPIALILGLVALRDLKRRPNLLGKGRAWFAIIMGGLFTLLLLVLAVNSFRE